MLRSSLVLFAIVATAPILRGEEARPLLSNGGFESQSGGKAADWGQAKGATFEAEGGNRFLRLCFARHKLVRQPLYRVLERLCPVVLVFLLPALAVQFH